MLLGDPWVSLRRGTRRSRPGQNRLVKHESSLLGRKKSPPHVTYGKFSSSCLLNAPKGGDDDTGTGLPYRPSRSDAKQDPGRRRRICRVLGGGRRPASRWFRGARDSLGRVVVDASLRAPAAPDVFVSGDAAAADTGDGHRTLQSCQHAGQLGRVAGENAARDLLGLPLVPYEQPRYVTCLDLGRSDAVITHGWERRIEKTGEEGKAVKRMINTQLIYPPAEDTADALLAASSIDLAKRAGRVVGSDAGLDPVPGKAA